MHKGVRDSKHKVIFFKVSQNKMTMPIDMRLSQGKSRAIKNYRATRVDSPWRRNSQKTVRGEPRVSLGAVRHMSFLEADKVYGQMAQPLKKRRALVGIAQTIGVNSNKFERNYFVSKIQKGNQVLGG